MVRDRSEIGIVHVGWAVAFSCVILVFLASCEKEQSAASIDRLALVTRHNVILHEVDTLGSLSVGNGEFAFTVDVSGLQTFYESYENGIPLGTQAQWAWHRMPSERHFSINDVAEMYTSCDGTEVPYAVQHTGGIAGAATKSLRANPHRLHLGTLGLVLRKENGEEAEIGDLKEISQQLDLWSGGIESTYKVEGVPVRVMLYSHQDEDRIAVRIESPLIKSNRLGLKLSFPYGSDCHVCPGYDWSSPDDHVSEFTLQGDHEATIKHTLDTTLYYAHVSWNGLGKITETKRHQFEFTPEKNEEAFEFSLRFDQLAQSSPMDYESTRENSKEEWKSFWSGGGAVDLSACTDPRAFELERRIVLSQYLTRVQCAGTLPPQETGLTMNSWYGKFHLEMHWWHAAQFVLWGRAPLLEKSMAWYQEVMPKAMATAKWQGYDGARWQKMTDPYGDESPSDVGAFIIWQQPHPIYFAELLYRNNPEQATLQKYKDIVFNTADFMASFVKNHDGQYHLCHPLIPAQEIFKLEGTDDPSFELQYWYFGLKTAQQWRRRLGMEENEKWKDVIDNLAALAEDSDEYLPNRTTPDAYRDDQFRRDHPSVVAAYGFLPLNDRIDTVIMKNTFLDIANQWQWDTTWGWDYPLMAMTAARLNQPEQAIESLLMDVQKNTYLVNGHNYQDNRLRLYLPGNGALLAAVAMMAAGWDGNTVSNPGFPKDGKWNVKWEGLQPLP